MTRMYELGFVVEPRQSDEEVQAITTRFKELIEGSGAEVTYIDSWGKRKLAYPIRKYNEGKYVFLYSQTTDNKAVNWSDIERLLQQDEKILRYLVVRTDADLKRAERKGKVKPSPPGTEPTSSTANLAPDLDSEGDDNGP